MDLTQLFKSAGAQSNVDPTLLQAMQQVEDAPGDPNAVGPKPAVGDPNDRAVGLMQIRMSNAKAAGIDPTDPTQAIPWAANTMAQNLKRYSGNVEQAVAAYHGGTDPQNWGPLTQQYVTKVASAFNQLKQGAPTVAQPQQRAADPLLAMAQGIAQGQTSQQAAPAQASDPLMAMAQTIASGKSAPAPAAGVTGAAVSQSAVGQQSGLAQDLAAGGGSPDTWSDIKSAAAGGAHGIGSMFNNAANFIERQAARVGIFPQTAANDTAIQAAADQEFAQTASPGQKAAAIVAPALLPMSGAMAPGNAVRAGVQALPTMGGTLGRVIGSTLGNATNGAIMATGAPINPNQPTGPQDARNVALGATLGVALPAAVNAGRAIGGSIYDAVRPVLNPQAYVGEGLANAIGDAAPDVANSIRTAPQYVPGSMPTTAQAAPNPTLVATEKAAANSVPGFKLDQAARENANNQARWDALGAVAQTPAALDAATQARAAAAGPLYEQARAGMYDVDAPLQALMQRPAMQQALQRGTAIASNEGNTGFVRAVEPIAPTFTNVPTGGVGFNGAPLMQQVQTSEGTAARPAQVLGDVLHYLKLGLDDLQASAQENTRLGPQERRAIGDAQNDFLNWLDNASPQYREARQVYAQMSPPVNTMQAGQQIAERLGNSGRALNSSGTAQMTAPGYATALGQALRQQEFGIDPTAQQSLENIGRDLQRSTISNSMRTPGSDTAYNLTANGWLARQLYGPAFGGAGNLAKGVGAIGATALGHPMVGLGILGGANKVGQLVGGRLNEQLGNLLLNPDALLPYLDARAAGPVNATQEALRTALGRQILPAVVGGVTRGGLVNAP